MSQGNIAREEQLRSGWERREVMKGNKLGRGRTGDGMEGTRVSVGFRRKCRRE